MALPAGKPLSGEAHGSLLDKAFSASLHGATLTDLMQQANAPIDFVMQSGNARIQVHALLQAPDETTGSAITFDLSAPHSAEISSWLGLKPGTDVPVNLHGNFQINNNSWHLSDATLQLGHSALSADILRTTNNHNNLIILNLTGDLIDADELQSLLPETNQDQPATQQSPASSMIDIPILPKGISLADADIVVRIKRIASSSPFALRDLRFDGRIREGMMYASPFSAKVAETDFNGAILLDLRTQKPSAGLWLGADAVNVGQVLNKLDISRNVDANFDHLSVYFDLHSSHLGQLLADSNLLANFDGGHFTLHDANTGGKMRIALDSGEIKSAAGSNVKLNLKGSLDSVPVSIAIQTAPAADLLNPSLSIPFKLNADTSGATIKLSGNIERPFAQKDIVLALEMSGTRFDELNALAQVSLPPWGPWSASGKFRMSLAGYEVSSLLLQVGDSQLSGYGKFETMTVPPRIEIALAAPTIQLDDF